MSEDRDDVRARIESRLRSMHYYGDPPDARLKGRVDADVSDILEDVDALLRATPPPDMTQREVADAIAARYCCTCNEDSDITRAHHKECGAPIAASEILAMLRRATPPGEPSEARANPYPVLCQERSPQHGLLCGIIKGHGLAHRGYAGDGMLVDVWENVPDAAPRAAPVPGGEPEVRVFAVGGKLLDEPVTMPANTVPDVPARHRSFAELRAKMPPEVRAAAEEWANARLAEMAVGDAARLREALVEALTITVQWCQFCHGKGTTELMGLSEQRIVRTDIPCSVCGQFRAALAALPNTEEA